MVITMNRQCVLVLAGTLLTGITIGCLLERNRTNRKLASILADRLANEGGK